MDHFKIFTRVGKVEVQVLASGDTLTGKVTREGENSIRITSGTDSIVTGMEDGAANRLWRNL